MDARAKLETLDKEPKTSLALFKAAFSSVQGQEFAFAGRVHAVSMVPENSLSSRQAGKHSGLPPPLARPQVILKMTVIGVCFGNTLVPRITVLVALVASSSSFYQEARDVISLGKKRSAQEPGHSGFSQVGIIMRLQRLCCFLMRGMSRTSKRGG